MKRVIILERVPGNLPAMRIAFWLEVPAELQAKFANPRAQSAFRGVSVDELQALRDGVIVERVEQMSSKVALTLTEIRAGLEAAWRQKQDELTAAAGGAGVIGSAWDGAAWAATVEPPPDSDPGIRP